METNGFLANQGTSRILQNTKISQNFGRASLFVLS
jgi:hypothetical protein